MATSSAKTFLMKFNSTGSKYEKLIDIKEFPDLGSAPDTLDTTTLSHLNKTYINDILDSGALEFNANYTKEEFAALKLLEGKKEKYAIWFGGVEKSGAIEPDGKEGKFEFEGELAVWVKGAGVSAVREMGISIAPSGAIVCA